MRRLAFLLLVASVACGTSSTTNAGAPTPSPQRPAGSGYEDATPLSQTSMDSPVGAPTMGTPPTVQTLGSQYSVSGNAPIVRNDVVRAREQALTAAFQNAVRAAATALGKTPGNDIVNHARSYLNRYSITREQNDPGSSYTVDIDAEVDTERLKDALADGGSASPASGGSLSATGDAGASSKGARTILLTVHKVRRARDLRGVADLLRSDRRVHDIRQQFYKQQRAILEVDITGTAEDVAHLIEPFATEDGVSLVIDKRTETDVEATLKLPL